MISFIARLVKRAFSLFRWLTGIFIILLGMVLLFDIGLAGMLMIFVGLLFIPAITKCIPLFKGRRIVISICMCLMFFGALAATPKTYNNNQQSMSKTNENVEGADEKKYDELESVQNKLEADTDEISKGSKSKTEPEEEETSNKKESKVKKTVDMNEFSNWMTKVIKQKNTIDTDELKKWTSNVTQDQFYTTWKNAVIEVMDSQTFDGIDNVSKYFSDSIKVYNSAYGDKTNSKMSNIKRLIDELSECSKQVIDIQNKYSFDMDLAVQSLSVQNVYITQRLEGTYSNDVLDSLKDFSDLFSSDNSSEWVSYNVEYIYNNAIPGDNITVIRSDTLNPFNKQGVWEIQCFNTGETKDVIDGNGFTQTVPVYHLVIGGSTLENDILTYQSDYDRGTICWDMIVQELYT